jgi:hypothetical protein
MHQKHTMAETTGQGAFKHVISVVISIYIHIYIYIYIYQRNNRDIGNEKKTEPLNKKK